MTPQDEHTIRAWAARAQTTATVLLAGGQGDPGVRLAFFCDQLTSLAPHVRIDTEVSDPFASPALIVGRHRNIAFQAIPEGKVLRPFLDALSPPAATPAPQDPDVTGAVARIELPVELTLYIAMQCPHCPRVVHQMVALCEAAQPIRLVIVDGVLLADQAAAHGVRSVPTLILDDHIRWSGRVDTAEVVRQCIERDPALLSAGGLRRILEAGDASRAAAMMIAHGRTFPALVTLLTHERWPVRLGAMVTVEYLAESSPKLAAQLVPPLWERFDTLDEQVQGDVVQVLSRIGGSSATRCLREIAAGDYPASVVDAAVEELADGPST